MFKKEIFNSYTLELFYAAIVQYDFNEWDH